MDRAKGSWEGLIGATVFHSSSRRDQTSAEVGSSHTFLAQAPGRQGGVGSGPAAGPPPPPGNPFEVVTAECDDVTVVHRNNRQDPTATPGTWYEVFTFDTFRVRNGKLVEHWDGAVINPPAQQTPAGGRSPQ